MSVLPTDWPSFLWGIAIGGFAALFSGVIKKAGEDLYEVIKVRVKSPEPILVAQDFNPVLYESGECAWVPGTKLQLREGDGYTYYPHPKRGAKCFRMTYIAHGQVNEYLMVKPNAKRRGT